MISHYEERGNCPRSAKVVGGAITLAYRDGYLVALYERTVEYNKHFFKKKMLFSDNCKNINL